MINLWVCTVLVGSSKNGISFSENIQFSGGAVAVGGGGIIDVWFMVGDDSSLIQFY